MRDTDNKQSKSVHSITEGAIAKPLLALFFPIMFGTFFQQLYNTSDAVIVGNFVGKEALAAVGGPTGVLINLLVGFFTGLSSGATVIISQFYGARKDDNVNRAVHTSLMLAIVGGLCLTLIGLLFAPAALTAIGTPDDILQHSVLYLRVYFIGMIPSMIYNMGSGILRAVGDTKRPLYYLIFSCFLNIALDILFVAVLPLGVVGAALATVLAQLISAGLILFVLYRSQETYQFVPSRLYFTSNILRNIVHIGLPAGLQSVMYSFSNVIIQSSVNSFGTDTIAAWTAYSKIDGLFWMTMGAMGVAVTTFAGQNYGAKQYDRIRRCVRISLLTTFAITIIISTVLLLCGPLVFRLFTEDSIVIDKGVAILRFMVPCYLTYICIEILSGAVRGAGNALIPMVMTCFGVCVLRIVWIFTAVPKWNSMTTVMMSYPITWVTTSVLFILYYASGVWLKHAPAAD